VDVHVGVEVDPRGQAMAWVAELPGCYARGRTAREAVDKVPLAVEEFCAWLKAHGEEVDPPGAVGVVAVETVLVDTDLGQGLSAALFSFDRKPVAPGVPSLALRAAHYARADLLALLPSLSQSSTQEPLEGTVRTLPQTLDHLLLMDVWFVVRLLAPEMVEERRYLLAALRDACLPILAAWADEEEPAPVRVQRASTGEAGPEEEWTGYKVLRRVVWHDRLHFRGLARHVPRPS
jgi:predicted RNase H-like HicB family nuclease